MYRKRKNKVPRKSLMKQIQYYNNSKYNLFLKESQIPGAGLGVYTKDFIANDQIIGEYEGKAVYDYDAIDDDYYFEIVPADDEKRQRSFGITCLEFPRCYMAILNDAEYKSNFKNNCIFAEDQNEDNYKKKVYILSTRDIQPGEELFCDYGDSYWSSKEFNEVIDSIQPDDLDLDDLDDNIDLDDNVDLDDNIQLDDKIDLDEEDTK